jgi:hypothetical protein
MSIFSSFSTQQPSNLTGSGAAAWQSDPPRSGTPSRPAASSPTAASRRSPRRRPERPERTHPQKAKNLASAHVTNSFTTSRVTKLTNESDVNYPVNRPETAFAELVLLGETVGDRVDGRQVHQGQV